MNVRRPIISVLSVVALAAGLSFWANRPSSSLPTAGTPGEPAAAAVSAPVAPTEPEAAVQVPLPVVDSFPLRNAALEAASADPLRPEPAVAPAETPAEIPVELAWAASMFGKVEQVAFRELPPEPNGQVRRERLLATDFKYGMVRVEEVWSRNGQGGEVLLDRKLMAAGHVMAMLPPDLSPEDLAAMETRAGFKLLKRLPASGLSLLALDPVEIDSVPVFLTRLKDAGVAVPVAEPDYLVGLLAPVTPNDSMYSMLWAMHTTGSPTTNPDVDIDAPEAWGLRHDAPGIVVGVIDTGIDHNHPDLAANIWVNPGEVAGNGLDDDHNGFVDDVRGWNFYGNTSNAMDDQYHGTHCAGTIGASGNNNRGVVGVCWQVKMVPLKFLSASGSGATSDAIEAVSYATSIGVHLTSNSWGGGGYSTLLYTAIQQANAAGIGFVAAAGNAGQNTDISPNYPSGYTLPNIVSVAATDGFDTLASFSNYGQSSVDIAAPGVGIQSTSPANSYRSLSGTSMATPHVAGALALFKAHAPGLTFLELRQALLQTAQPVPALTGKCASGGRLNLHALLKSVRTFTLDLVDLTVSDREEDGGQGNGNDRINPGESVAIWPQLANAGPLVAPKVEARIRLSSPDPWVTLTQTVARFGDIAAGDEAVGDQPLSLTISTNAPAGHVIAVVLDLLSEGEVVESSDPLLVVHVDTRLEGRVLARTGGQPIPFATVRVDGPLSAVTTSGADGRYSFSLIEGGYDVRATAAGYTPEAGVAVTLPPDQLAQDILLGKSVAAPQPASLALTVNEGQGATNTLSIANTGDSALAYHAVTGFDAPGYELDGVAGSLPFADGFESGGVSEWVVDNVQSTAQVLADARATGSFGLRLAYNGVNAHKSGLHHDFTAGVTPSFARFSLRVDSVSDSKGYFVLTDTQSGKDAVVFSAGADGLFAVNADVVGGSRTFAYTPGRWHGVELRNFNWTARTFDFAVDGQLVASGIPLRGSGTVSSVNRLSLYNFSSGSVAWFDNIAVSARAADWLTAVPLEGTVPAGSTAPLQLQIDTTGLAPRQYLAQIGLHSNDPLHPVVQVPVTLTVAAVPNDPPVADAQTVPAVEDTPVTIALSGSDPNGNSLVCIITDLPDVGKLYQTADGVTRGAALTAVPATVSDPSRRVIFVPGVNESGQPYDTFAFKVNDRKLDSPAATVTVNVAAVNDPPAARNDVYYGQVGVVLPALPVLANDADAEPGALVIQSLSTPARGAVSLNSDQTLRYEPQPSFTTGSDTFTYVIADGGGLLSTGTVTIAIGATLVGDWPTIGGNNEHTGYFNGTLGAASFVLQYEKVIPYFAKPIAIADDRIFVSFSSKAGSTAPLAFHVYEMSTGTLEWTHSYGSTSIVNSPTYHKGQVFVERNNGNGAYPYGRIHCLDARTGALLWQFDHADSNNAHFSPLVDDNGVYFPGGSTGGIYGVNRHDGTQRFHFPIAGDNEVCGPALWGGKIVSYVNTSFSVINPQTGLEEWGLTFGAPINNPSLPKHFGRIVCVAGDRAYVTSFDNKAYCIDLVTRSIVWSAAGASSALYDGYLGKPSVAAGVVYVPYKYTVRALNAATGAYIGDYNPSDSSSYLAASPIVLNDAIVCSNASKTYIFNLASRTLRQTLNHGGQLSLGNGFIIIGHSANYSETPPFKFAAYRLQTPNTAPVATAQTVSLDEDTGRAVQLGGTDGDGDPVHALVQTLPAKGSLYQVNADGTRAAAITAAPSTVIDAANRVWYEPLPNEYGSPYTTFQFHVSDGKQSSASPATVTINVAPVNDPIAAGEDVVSIRPGQIVEELDLLHNDLDGDGGVIQLVDASLPSRGVITTNLNTSIRYVPDPDFRTGEDEFTYRVTDGNGATGTARVVVRMLPPFGSDWATLGNGPAHDGASSVSLGLGTWASDWTFPLGSAAALNAAAVSDGRVFLTHAPVSGSVSLIAIDSVSGAEIWRLNLGPCSSATPPTVRDGRVFTACFGTSGGSVRAVDAETGALLWSTPFASAVDSAFAPTVSEQAVWVRAQNGKLGAFHPDTGASLLSLTVQESDLWTPTLAFGELYTWLSTGLSALAPSSGAAQWSLTLPSAPAAATANTVAVAGPRMLHLIGGTGLYAVDPASRKLAWQANGTFLASPAAHHGRVYAVTGGTGAKTVVARDALNGQVLQTFVTGDSSAVFHPPVLTQDKLVVSSSTATRLFRLRDAALVQTITAPGPATVTDPRLFVAGTDGQLRTYLRSDLQNQAPVASAITVRIIEDSLLPLMLDGADPEGDPLRPLIRTLPAQGTLYQTNDGTTPAEAVTRVPALVRHRGGVVLYRPAANANGTAAAQFQYSVRDAVLVSAPATVTVDIEGVNDAPLPRDDRMEIAADQVVADLGVLLNDVDPDGEPLAVVDWTQPEAGWLERNAAGDLRFLPTPGATNAVLHFTYTVEDPQGNRGSASAELVMVSNPGQVWESLGAGPARTGHVPVNAGLQAWQDWWGFTFTRPVNPVAVGPELVYVTTGASTTATNLVYAFDRLVGNVAWQQPFAPANSMDPPTWHGGKAYFTRGNHLLDSALWCLDGTSGAPQWTAPYEIQFDVAHAPAVTDDGVWFNGGATGGVYGMDPLGALRFHETLEAGDEWTPAVADGRLYTWVSGRLRAHDPLTGQAAWTNTLVNGASAFDSANRSPCVGNGKVFVTWTGGLYAVDSAAGTNLWSVAGTWAGTPASAGNLVFALSGSQVRAVHAADGVAWKTYTATETLRGQPLVTRDLVIACSTAKTFVFNLRTGALLQTLPFGGAASLAGGTLYVAGPLGRLQAYRQPGLANHTPLAVPAVVSGEEDADILVTLQGTDADGDGLSALVTRLPAHGTLHQTTDGFSAAAPISSSPAAVTHPGRRLIYRPEANAHGTPADDFQFLVHDGKAPSAPASVTVNLTPVNDAPTARDDVFAVPPGQAISPLPLLANDADVDGEPVAMVAHTEPLVGALARAPGGELFYLAPANVTNALDSFTYTLRDPSGLEDTATVHVHIHADAGQNWAMAGRDETHAGFVPVSFADGNFSLLWSQSHPAALHRVAVEGQRVVIVPAASAGTGQVLARDRLTGAQLWQRNLGPAARMNPPSLVDGRVYIQQGNQASSQLRALRADTGADVWSAAYAEQLDDHESPLVMADGVYVNGGRYGGLLGFARSSGASLFLAALPQYDEWTPVASDGRLHAWVAGSFTEFDTLDGTALRTLSLGWNWNGWYMRTLPAVSEGRAFLVGSPGLHAVDLASGTLAWSVGGQYAGSPAAANGTAYVIEGDDVVARSVGSGAVQTRFETGDAGLRGQPVVANNRLLVASSSATHIFELPSGAHLQTLPAGGHLSLTRDHLFLAGSDGTLRVYAAPGAVNFSPDGGVFDEPVTVTLTAPNPSALIYYSVDDTPPAFSQRFVTSGQSIVISASSELRAVTIDGNRISPVRVAQFHIRDDDDDDLPDWWERDRFGGTTAASATSDNDGDGLSTLSEFVAGSDALSASALFSVQSVESGAGAGNRIRWPSSAGHLYQVFRSEDLQNWIPLSNEMTGTGGQMQYLDTESNPSGRTRYYRVKGGL